ncbi:MAG: hypothetical protein ACOYY2_15565 [Actinomycetota bacterium]
MSGLIYAGIIAVWAVVLIPMFLRRHEGSESRSVDRFTTAMRLLRRPGMRSRPAATVRPASLASAGQGGTAAPFVKRGATPGPAGRAGSRGRPVAGPAGRLLRRRRRILLVLTVATLLAGVLAALGVLAGWLVALPTALLAAYVSQLRRLARRHQALARRRTSTSRTQAARRRREDRVARLRAARDRLTRRPEESDPETEEFVSGLRADDEWDLRPWPLPTYVTAPPAPRVTRTIDLSTPGSWAAPEAPSAPAEGAAPPAPRRSDVTLRDVLGREGELDEILERRRAVGD